MQRKNGASKRVLNHIRNSEYYDVTAKEEARPEVRMRNFKPTGRRKVVQGTVKPDGTWRAGSALA